MFTIIGGDGKEYGPVTVEQVQQWLAAGRANLATQAKKAGEDQWRRVGDFEEFSPAGAPPAPPPVIPGDGTLGGRGARTGAALINAAIYVACMMPGALMMAAKAVALGAHSIADLDMNSVSGGTRVMQLGAFAAITLQTCLLTFRGQNIGMLLTGLRVVRFSDSLPAGFLHGALLRFLVPVSLMFMPGFISFLGLMFLCVDYCFIFRADRRCVHDLIADTKVVKA